MIGTNTAKFRDIDKEAIVDKISKLANELDVGDEIITFIKQMITLSILLSTYDPSSSATIRTIDEKAQDPS